MTTVAPELEHAPTGRAALLPAVNALLAEVFGGLLADPAVSNVLVLPPGTGERCARVLVRDGAGVRLSHLAEVAGVRRLLAYLAGLARRELRPGRATLDAVLPGGERLHAVIDPVAPGPSVAVRKPLPGRVTLEDWRRWGAISAPQADALRGLVADRVPLLLAGEVDTGKTTLLRACLEEPAFRDGLPAVLQDPFEFTPPCPNAWSLAADPWADPPATLEALVAGALRVPISHLVIGEVRRAEARAMVVAWATGHPGLCTVHAGSAADALDRVAQMVGLAGVAMDAVQMRWVAKAVGAVAHLGRGPDGRRQVTAVARVEGYDPRAGEFRLRPLA